MKIQISEGDVKSSRSVVERKLRPHELRWARRKSEDERIGPGLKMHLVIRKMGKGKRALGVFLLWYVLSLVRSMSNE